MRIGIISDIHSNLEALEAILQRIKLENVERLYCLGDIVGYGPNPNECVEKVRELCHVSIMGNHDAALMGAAPIHYFNSYARSAVEWTNRVISRSNMEFLSSLPMTHSEERILMVHATPLNPEAWDYIHSPDDANGHYHAMQDKQTAFIGHSHIPRIFEQKETGKRIINIGSVGQPRDRDPRACCGLFDTDAGTFEWLREVYPVQITAEKIRLAGLPEFLAVRLFMGM
jgi:putative phosphoesterase